MARVSWSAMVRRGWKKRRRAKEDKRMKAVVASCMNGTGGTEAHTAKSRTQSLRATERRVCDARAQDWKDLSGSGFSSLFVVFCFLVSGTVYDIKLNAPTMGSIPDPKAGLPPCARRSLV
eukprot:685730-Hanusia_phi.AAC.4